MFLLIYILLDIQAEVWDVNKEQVVSMPLHIHKD